MSASLRGPRPVLSRRFGDPRHDLWPNAAYSPRHPANGRRGSVPTHSGLRWNPLVWKSSPSSSDATSTFLCMNAHRLGAPAGNLRSSRVPGPSWTLSARPAGGGEITSPRCRWRNRKLEILWHFPKLTHSAQAGTSIVWVAEFILFLHTLLILTLALSERPRSQNQVNLLLFHWLISLAYFVVFILAVGDNCPPSDVPLKKVSSPWTSTRFGVPAVTWLMVSPSYAFPGSGGQFIRVLFAHRRTEEAQVLCCLTDSPFKLAGKLGLREVVQEL